MKISQTTIITTIDVPFEYKGFTMMIENQLILFKNDDKYPKWTKDELEIIDFQDCKFFNEPISFIKVDEFFKLMDFDIRIEIEDQMGEFFTEQRISEIINETKRDIKTLEL